MPDATILRKKENLNKREQVGERLPGASVGAEHDAGTGQHRRDANALDLRGLGDAHLPERGHHLLPEAELLEALRGLDPLPLPLLRAPLRAPRGGPRGAGGGGVLEVAEAEALEEELVPRRGSESGGRAEGGGGGGEGGPEEAEPERGRAGEEEAATGGGGAGHRHGWPVRV